MEKKLIHIVRENRFLFDKSMEDYKNKKKKDRKWQEISQTLCVHGKTDTAKKRWRSLRDRFKRELKRIGSTPSMETPRWKFFDALSFLANLDELQNPNGTYEDPFEMSFEDQKPIRSMIDTDIGEAQFEIAQGYDTITPTTLAEERTTRSETKTNINHDIPGHVAEAHNKFLQFVDKASSSCLDMSPIQLFMLSMAKQVDEANLPLEQWTELQINLINIVKDTLTKYKQ